MENVPRINIFKPSRFTAVDGQQVEFALADLEASAEAYDPALDPAPLVVGHPKLDAPAWGWVKRLISLLNFSKKRPRRRPGRLNSDWSRPLLFVLMWSRLEAGSPLSALQAAGGT